MSPFANTKTIHLNRAQKMLCVSDIRTSPKQMFRSRKLPCHPISTARSRRGHVQDASRIIGTNGGIKRTTSKESIIFRGNAPGPHHKESTQRSKTQ